MRKKFTKCIGSAIIPGLPRSTRGLEATNKWVTPSAMIQFSCKTWNTLLCTAIYILADVFFRLIGYLIGYCVEPVYMVKGFCGTLGKELQEYCCSSTYHITNQPIQFFTHEKKYWFHALSQGLKTFYQNYTERVFLHLKKKKKHIKIFTWRKIEEKKQINTPCTFLCNYCSSTWSRCYALFTNGVAGFMVCRCVP